MFDRFVSSKYLGITDKSKEGTNNLLITKFNPSIKRSQIFSLIYASINTTNPHRSITHSSDNSNRDQNELLKKNYTPEELFTVINEH